MARAEILAHGPDLPETTSWFFSFNDYVDRIRHSTGQDWVDKGQDEAPYIAKMVRSASRKIQMVSGNPNADLFGDPRTAQATREMLERGVKIEIVASESKLSAVKEALGASYDEEQVHLYSTGDILPRLQFIIVDSIHTLVKPPDSQNVPYPGAIVQWNDKKTAKIVEEKFRRALVMLGIIEKEDPQATPESPISSSSFSQRVSKFLGSIGPNPHS